MASIVSNAVGTQRQFTKQPESTYQSRLVGVRDSSFALTGERRRQLVNALSDFSAAVTTYYKDKDKRQQIYAQRAEDLINCQTDEDWMTLSAIDIANKAGDFSRHLVDNPYFIALAEKARGNYFKNKANTEYQKMVTESGGYLNSAYEENKRYEKFMYDYYRNTVGYSSNNVAFSRGYFQDFQKDRQTNWEAAQVQSSQREKTIALATVTTDMDNAIQDLIVSNNPDAVEPLLTPLLNTTTMINLEPAEQIKMVNSLVERLSNAGVPPEIVERVLDMDMPPMTARGYLDPVKIREVVPGSVYFHNNDVSNRQNGTLETAENMAAWAQMDDEQMLDWWYKQNDREKYRYRVPFWREWGRKRDAKQGLIAKQALQNSTRIAGEAMRAMCAQYFARIENRDSEVPTRLSDWKYEFYNGQVYTSDRIPDEKIKEYFQEYIASEILQDNKATPEEKATRVLNLLSYPALKQFASGYTANITNALATISPQKQKGDVDYDTIDIALNMVKSNPGLSKHLMGSDTYGSIQAISAMSKTLGSTQSAIDAYTRVRNMDSDTRTALLNDIKSYESSNGITMINAEGDSVDINYSDPFLKPYFEQYSLAMRATGLPQEKVNELCKASYENNWMVWNTNMLPLAIFKDINAIDPQGVGVQYMQDMVNQFAEQEMQDPYFFNWQYSVEDNAIKLYGADGSTIRVYTVDEFAKECNKVMYQKFLVQQEEKKERQDRAEEIFAPMQAGVGWGVTT